VVGIIENNVDSPNFRSSARGFFFFFFKADAPSKVPALCSWGEKHIRRRVRAAYENMRFLWNTFEGDFGFNDFSTNVD